MDAVIQLYVDRLKHLRGRLKEAVQGMSVEELNWVPPVPETNSAYVLAFHLPGSESVWIHQVVGGREVPRDREAEFLATGDSAAALIERIDEVAATSQDVLGKLSGEDLEQIRSTPPHMPPNRVTVGWCILHMIEHYAEHLGHLGLTKQLYEAKFP